MKETLTKRMELVRDIGQRYVRRRYTILFCSLMLFMVVSPLSAALGFRGELVDFILAANLALAVAPVNTANRRNPLIAAVVFLILVRILTLWLGLPSFSALALGCWTLVGLIAAGVALRFALQGGRITSEHLYAALSSYLLAGIYFGLLYWVLNQIHPGSFNVAGGLSRNTGVYFSFVVLATLGFGDIVPLTDVSRGITVVEAIGGQLFLAVLVARLLGSFSHSRKD
jgi:voltage-gated potassium channel